MYHPDDGVHGKPVTLFAPVNQLIARTTEIEPTLLGPCWVLVLR